jgi:hypothetical protein
MKKLGYYPALTILMLVYITAIGFFVMQSVATLDKMKKYKSSGEMLRISQKQLEDEQKKLAENQKIDKIYNDYFARWLDKEGRIDESKLKQKLQKMAEELGVNVIEVSPLNMQSGVRSNRLGPKMPSTRAVGAPPPGMPIPPVITTQQSRNLIELKVTMVGPFQQLMAWMRRAENEMGSLRIVQTRWVARSPEEVRLTVGFRYKMIGEIK